tara:strand:- start:323 stop:1003 length:681 start_codon:yes stop_codon:yes gene_type:complete
MNKSLLTNLATLLITLYGAFSPIYSAEIFMAGLFGLSGGLTNWLAIHMLFEKIPFLFGSGVIPMRFKELKEGIKNLIMHEFFSKESVIKFAESQNMTYEDFFDKIDYDIFFKKFVDSIKESSLGSMLEMVGGEKALEPLKEPLKIKIKEAVNELQDSNLNKKNESLVKIQEAIENLIDLRLNELTPEQVKIIIKDIIHKHLGWLVVWGGVFGFLIGLILGFLGGVS